MHVRLRIGGEAYALPVDDVRSVATAAGVTPVPGAPSAFLGVQAVAGRLLPVVDLGAMLGLVGGEGVAPSRIVVVADGGRRLGLAVEAVDDVAQLPGGEEAPASPLLRERVLMDGALVGVIDLPAVLGELERELAR